MDELSANGQSLAEERDTVASQQPEQDTAIEEVHLNALSSVKRISRVFSLDRGLPIERYYIGKVLSVSADDIRGRVLEIGDNSYTRKFGGGRVIMSDVLRVAGGNPKATIIADLTKADHIPTILFDCIILAHTLQFIYDVRSAIATRSRILKDGGSCWQRSQESANGDMENGLTLGIGRSLCAQRDSCLKRYSLLPE